MSTILRNAIIARYEQKRGRPQTIIDLVKTYLIPGAFVGLNENVDGNMFIFSVYVRPEDILPGFDLDTLRRAITSIKPAGYTFMVHVTEAFAWNEATGVWDDALGPWNEPGTPPAP